MTDADEQLLKGCLAQDRVWQRRLFEKYKNQMYSVVYRILNNEDHAHDALQEGFIAVFRNLAQFQKKSSLQTWIKTIMVRKALRKLTTEHRYESLDAESGHTNLIVWPDQLTGEALDQAIRALPPGCRAVFTLIEIEGYAHQETAAMLRISEGTSKSQLHHAKKLLRTMLNEVYR